MRRGTKSTAGKRLGVVAKVSQVAHGKGSQNWRPVPLRLPRVLKLVFFHQFRDDDIVRAFPIGATNPVIILVININSPGLSVMVPRQIQSC